MTKDKFKHLWIELYGINLYWAVCDYERYKVLVRNEFKIEPPDETIDYNNVGKCQVYTKAGQQIVVIWLRKGRCDMGTLAHEVFHAAHWILQKKGLWLTDSSEEAYAYLIEFIIDKMKKAIK